ncbi:MAG: response regulator [Spirochaetes bacterium]|nr:response regulator [Spirochaetota bacterium]
MGKRILVIDDEETVLDALKIILEEMGHQVDTTRDPDRGERMALEEEYDLIITDLRMPGKTGDQIVKSVKAQREHARILVITAYSTDAIAQSALKAGALALIRKPFEISKILSFLEQE